MVSVGLIRWEGCPQSGTHALPYWAVWPEPWSLCTAHSFYRRLTGISKKATFHVFFFLLSIWMNDLQRKYLKSQAGIQRLSSCTHLYPFPTSLRSDILTLFFPCDPTATLCWMEVRSPGCVPSSGHCWPQSRPVCA